MRGLFLRLTWVGFGGALWILGGIIAVSITLLLLTVLACGDFISLSCGPLFIGALIWFLVIMAVIVWALSSLVLVAHQDKATTEATNQPPQ